MKSGVFTAKVNQAFLQTEGDTEYYYFVKGPTGAIEIGARPTLEAAKLAAAKLIAEGHHALGRTVMKSIWQTGPAAAVVKGSGPFRRRKHAKAGR